MFFVLGFFVAVFGSAFAIIAWENKTPAYLIEKNNRPIKPIRRIGGRR